MKVTKIPLAILQVMYTYDSDTGDLISRKTGKRVGHKDKLGYLHMDIKCGGKKRKLRINRVVWAMHTGIDPGELEIDHKNRDRSDNRISNLRPVTRTVNVRNSSCKSATPGLYKCGNKWRAQLRVKGTKHTGEARVCPVIAHMDHADLDAQSA